MGADVGHPQCCAMLLSPEDRVAQETLQTLRLFVLHHRTANRHHERHCCVDLLIGPRFGQIQVAAPVRFPNYVADTYERTGFPSWRSLPARIAASSSIM